MNQKTNFTKIINQNEINHVATEPLSCPPLETLPNKNNPVDCFCERKPEFLIPRRGRKRAAFTLAEVLITLAIIGVVAAITIPSLVKNYNEKAWGTAKDVFEKRLEVATRQMNTEEKLAGYSNTMDFVNELKKYIKITRVCDNNNITKCFNKEVIWNEGEDPVDMSEVTDASAFGLDWDTDTVAVQFANGVNAVIAYNPNTTQEPFNNTFSATAASMAILFDVSGYKNPNTNGKDIAHNTNIKQLAGVTGCLLPEDEVGFCITQILGPQNGGYGPLTRAECEAQKGDLGISACDYDDDYWAGAVKACSGTKNIPTQAQISQLATYLYNHDGALGAEDMLEAEIDTAKASLFLSNSPYSFQFNVWSSDEQDSRYVSARYFYSFAVYLPCSYYRSSRDAIAICIKS